MSQAPQPFEVIVLDGPLGAEIRGVDLRTLTDATFDQLHKLWQHHLLLLFRGQSITPPDLVSLIKRFGTPVSSSNLHQRDLKERTANAVFNLPPEVTAVTNIKQDGKAVGILGDGELSWHSDFSFKDRPTAARMLVAIDVPPQEKGGNTMFLNAYAAYDALPADYKRKLSGKTVKQGNIVDTAMKLRLGGTRTLAEDAVRAFARFRELAPQVVVMDIALPGVSGVEAMRRMLAENAATRVLMFSMYEDAIFATRALQAGASGYVSKASAPNVLVEAVLTVARGKPYVSAEIAQGCARASDLDTRPVLDILRGALDWEQVQFVEKMAPAAILLPARQWRMKLEYAEGKPPRGRAPAVRPWRCRSLPDRPSAPAPAARPASDPAEIRTYHTTGTPPPPAAPAPPRAGPSPPPADAARVPASP